MKHDPPAVRPWTIPENAACPVADTLHLLGGKHAARLLHCLTGGEMHFLELTRALDGISRRVLSAQLSAFEQAGLVRRVQKDDARRRVGYSLTPKGQALGAILSQMYDWAIDHSAA